jgi:hypothetical protein
VVAGRFGGDYRAAFGHYNAVANVAIRKGVRKALPKDVGVGSGLTRWAWADGLIHELDADVDGHVSWDQFKSSRA